MKTKGLNTTSFEKHSPEDYKKHTRNHWQNSPCGSNYSDSRPLTKEYFDEIEEHRYKTHPWIKNAIESFDISGQDVLEIGYGMGSDHLLLARQKANMHGLDLTPRNKEITKLRFELYNETSKLVIGDAENLPYPDNSFDFVYSFGVIHHSPDTQKIINDIFRVLRKNGRCYITVYHKNSIFFWWSTFCVNFLLKNGWQHRTLQQQISLIEYPNISDNLVLKLYKKHEFSRIFNLFSHSQCSIEHLLPIDMQYLSRMFKQQDQPTHLLTKIGKKFGWYIIIEATK